MTARIPLEDRIGLATEERAALERTLAGQVTLQEVVSWGLAQRPPQVISDVVAQDEFTHDVLLPLAGGRYLVYDTT